MNFGLKLVAVVDKGHVIFYEAEGLKIRHKINSINIVASESRKKDGHQGSFRKESDPHGAFAAHTAPKELEDQDAARTITGYLEDMMNGGKYKELLIASSPKMLGYVRQYASSHLKDKISKEIDKDLVHEDVGMVQRKLFG